jgi:hypothetical protein
MALRRREARRHHPRTREIREGLGEADMGAMGGSPEGLTFLRIMSESQY